MALQDLIIKSYPYYFEKVSDGIYDRSKLGYARVHLKILQDITENIRKEAGKLSGGIKALPALELMLNDMNYVAKRLSEFIESNNLYQNEDARIFIFAYSKQFHQLIDMLKEIDQPE